MKTKTPKLTEMGVMNPEQIIGYASVQISEDMDVLKINYKRPKGSFLPKRRRYEFKRIGKPMPGSDLRGVAAIRYEISPMLSQAAIEMDAILADSKRMVATKESLKAELDAMKAELTAHITHLSEMIDTLD